MRGTGEGVVYPTGGVYSMWMALADVDTDGDLDVVVANRFSSDLSTLLNDGAGALGAPIVQPYAFLSPGFIAAGDINGDAVLDLVVNKAAGMQAVTTMFGNGDGTFTPGASYFPSPTPAELLLMDLDQDGDVDLVVSSGNLPWEPVTFTTLTNEGDGTFTNAAPYWAPGMDGATALAASDINGDGVADVAVANCTTVAVFFGTPPAGTFTPGLSYGSGEAVAGLALGDVDGDGDIDLGTANSGGNSWNYSILWNRSCHIAVPLSPSDLNGDGQVDLNDYALLADCLSGPSISAPPPGCSPVTFGRADLTHDGHVELRDASRFLDAFGAP
ncbi:MAG TPA: FG-GAP-like repeat-containing protein [Phycisphaerae bacterium]